MPLILPFGDAVPRIGHGVFLAPNATLVGDIEIGDEASVWFGAVLRADIGRIRIGPRTNIQDLACIHMTDGLSNTIVGADVTVGHGAILHGCIVEDRCLIGMGSIILDNARIGAGSVIAIVTSCVAPARPAWSASACVTCSASGPSSVSVTVCVGPSSNATLPVRKIVSKRLSSRKPWARISSESMPR